jgi:hypothetical protein
VSERIFINYDQYYSTAELFKSGDMVYMDVDAWPEKDKRIIGKVIALRWCSVLGIFTYDIKFTTGDTTIGNSPFGWKKLING